MAPAAAAKAAVGNLTKTIGRRVAEPDGVRGNAVRAWIVPRIKTCSRTCKRCVRPARDIDARRAAGRAAPVRQATSSRGQLPSLCSSAVQPRSSPGQTLVVDGRQRPTATLRDAGKYEPIADQLADRAPAGCICVGFTSGVAPIWDRHDVETFGAQLFVFSTLFVAVMGKASTMRNVTRRPTSVPRSSCAARKKALERFRNRTSFPGRS